jgi:hypothetical protein
VIAGVRARSTWRKRLDSTGYGEVRGMTSEPGGDTGAEPDKAALEAQEREAELRALRARVAELEASHGGAAATAPGRPRHRLKSFFAAVCIVLAWLLAPLSIIAAWTSGIVGDTSRYVHTVSPLATNPDIQAAVANRVSKVVAQNLDLGSLVQEYAPADRPRLEQLLKAASGPIEGAITSFVHDQTLNVVSSAWFAQFWDNANRLAHSSVDKVLTGQGGGVVQVKDSAVTIDLAPVIDQVKTRLVDSGVTVAGKIPEVHTSFTVMQAKDIGKYRTLFRLLQVAGTWLPFVTLGLAGLGILLARNRRHAAVVAFIGVFVAAALVGILVHVFRTFYLGALPADVSQAAAGAAYDTLVRFLITTSRTAAVLGLVIGLAAWLAGPGRVAGFVRGFWRTGIDAVRGFADHIGMKTGPVGPFVRRRRNWIIWIVVLIAAILLLTWSYPTGMVVFWLAFACVVALAVVEFLADRPAPVGAAGGTGSTGSTGAVGSTGGTDVGGRGATATPPSTSESTGDDGPGDSPVSHT